MALGRFLGSGGNSAFLTRDHIADVDVFLLGPKTIDAAKAFLTSEGVEPLVLQGELTPAATVMATTADTRAAVPGTTVQFVFGMFGSTQDQVLQSFDMDAVAAGLRKAPSGAIELGTLPSTRAAWATGIATVVNGTLTRTGRFTKLFDKGFKAVKFASSEVEAAAKACIAGPEDLSRGQFRPQVHVANEVAMLCAPTLEAAIALLVAAREANAAKVAAAHAARDAYFQTVVEGKAADPKPCFDIVKLDPASVFFPLAAGLPRFEAIWEDAVARGVLTASYRKTGLDMFYGHTYIADFARDSARVQKFLEPYEGSGPVLDIALRVFKKVLDNDEKKSAASFFDAPASPASPAPTKRARAEE